MRSLAVTGDASPISSSLHQLVLSDSFSPAPTLPMPPENAFVPTQTLADLLQSAAPHGVSLDYFRDQIAAKSGVQRLAEVEIAVTHPRSDDFAVESNPLLDFRGLPRWNEIKAEHVLPAASQIALTLRASLEALEEKLAKIASPTWNDVQEPLSDILEPYARFSVLIAELKDLNPPEGFKAAYKQANAILVDLGLRIGQSAGLYQAYKAIRDGVEWFRLSETQRRIVEISLRDAKLAGIGLSETDREKFNAIEKRLAELYTQFRDNVTQSLEKFKYEIVSGKDIPGLNADDRKLMANDYAERWNAEHENKIEPDPENGPWLVTEESLDAILTRCENRGLRETLYRLSLKNASEGEHDNAPLIPEILKLRAQKAKLLGFGTFAELSLSRKMAGKVEAAEKLIAELHDAADEKARAENVELTAFAKKSGFEGELMPWDRGFYLDKLQKQTLGFDDEVIKSYFSFDKTIDGVFDIAERLFNVTFKRADGEAPVYHPDVRFYKVFNASGAHIASFYVDPYIRLGAKRSGAWMDEIVRRKVTADGKVQIPVAILSYNLERSGRLGLWDLDTIPHELGHGLQQMLTVIGEAEASGTQGIEWDAVEIASQFLEYWIMLPEILKKISAHKDKGTPISDELIAKMRASRTFFAASAMVGQLVKAATDLELHHRYDPDNADGKSVYDVYRDIFQRMTGRQPLPEDRYLNTFNHLFGGEGYAAGYFSYKWAEVLSADYFSAFEPFLSDPDAIRVIGKRLRDTLFAQGGGRHPALVFLDFMGREFSTKALLKQNGLD